MKKFFDLYKTDRLWFLGGLLQGIAKGALAIGKKIVTSIKNKREKKVAKAAEKLLSQKERLAQAEALVSGTGTAGAGVSGFSQMLTMIKGGGAALKADKDLATEVRNPTDAPGGFPEWAKWGLLGLGALIVLKKLKIF